MLVDLDRGILGFGCTWTLHFQLLEQAGKELGDINKGHILG